VTAVIVGYYGMLVAHFSLASVFTSVQPDFRCDIDGSGNFNQSAFAEAYPDGDFCLIKQSFCEDYQTRDCALFTGESIGSEENLKCTDFVFDHSVWEKTTMTEFELICDKSKKAEVPDAVYMAGMAVSMVLMGGVSDMYGRQRTLFWCNFFLVISSFLQIPMQNVAAFSAMRFFQGFFCSSGYSAAFIYLSEIVKSERRAKLGLSINALFGAGSIAYTLGGLMFRDWHHLVTWVSCHTAAACVGVYFMDESPRWLISRDRAKDAFDISVKIARKNNKPEYTESMFEEADSKVESAKVTNVSLLTLFKSPLLAKITLVQCYLWAAIAMAYYGISLNVADLPGSIFANNFYMGCMEIFSVIVLMFTLDGISRHRVTAATFAGAGLCCVLTGVLSEYGDSESSKVWATIFALGGKFFSSACYSCIYIYSAELYPTSCRSTGFSCCVLSSRLATIVVPEIVAVSRSGAAWFAPVFFGCACLVAACGTWWLPDTFGVPLLETLEDAEKFYAKPSRTKRRGGDTSNLAADF